ncbi:MAG: cell division protein ZapA [Ruminococcus sp.]|nr:cell division protein ZapA [Ruminococcus sp.]
MEKKKVTVFVAGQKLTLITTDSEKYVSDIAQKVDTTINSLMSTSNMSREKCAVMAALDFCDDEAKARATLNDVKEQIKDYIDDSAKLRAENEALKAEVEKLRAEKAELLTSKKTLVASAVEIKHEKKTETKEESEVQIDSSDDLSFDFDEDVAVAEEKEEMIATEPTATTPVNNAPVTSVQTPKSEKKRHNHNHSNPYKERFLKQQNEQKGYTPVRQYSLFDNDNK